MFFFLISSCFHCRSITNKPTCLIFQGDKFMRLPSHTYDPKDLLRNMSVPVDGPEEIIEGDDYLQPTTSITELPEENSVPMSNGKVRVLGLVAIGYENKVAKGSISEC